MERVLSVGDGSEVGSEERCKDDIAGFADDFESGCGESWVAEEVAGADSKTSMRVF